MSTLSYFSSSTNELLAPLMLYEIGVHILLKGFLIHQYFYIPIMETEEPFVVVILRPLTHFSLSFPRRGRQCTASLTRSRALSHSGTAGGPVRTPLFASSSPDASPLSGVV